MATSRNDGPTVSPVNIKLEEDESCINSCFKKVFSNLNGVLVIFGLLLFAIGLWFIFSDWGNVDPSFFLGMGICVTLAGVIVGCLAWIGQHGVILQTRTVGTFWSGRKLLFFYDAVFFLILCSEAFFIYISLSVLRDLLSVHTDIMKNPENKWPALEGLELQLAHKFNLFFFGAATSCQDPKFIILWQFVDSECPETISSTRCRGCGDDYITQCYSDRTQCMDVENGDGNACAYTICRKNLLGFFIQNIYPIAYGIVGFISFQVVMLLMGIILLCFTKRDGIERQLKKTGTNTAVAATTTTATSIVNSGRNHHGRL